MVNCPNKDIFVSPASKAKPNIIVSPACKAKHKINLYHANGWQYATDHLEIIKCHTEKELSKENLSMASEAYFWIYFEFHSIRYSFRKGYLSPRWWSIFFKFCQYLDGQTLIYMFIQRCLISNQLRWFSGENDALHVIISCKFVIQINKKDQFRNVN